jgi:hypothetical protein
VGGGGCLQAFFFGDLQAVNSDAEKKYQQSFQHALFGGCHCKLDVMNNFEIELKTVTENGGLGLS